MFHVVWTDDVQGPSLKHAMTCHDYPGRIMYMICRPMYPPAVCAVRNLVARAASRCDRLSLLRLDGESWQWEKVLKV